MHKKTLWTQSGMDSVKDVDLLVTGWIRKYEEDHEIEIPDALKLLIFLYFPKIIDYQGKFTVHNVNHRISLITEYKIEGWRTAKCDIPLPVSIDGNNTSHQSINNMVYRWKVRLGGKINVGCEDHYMIGVISDRTQDLFTYPGEGLIDSYGIT